MAAPRCPICRKDIVEDRALNKAVPFCSARCQLVDLGGWLGGRYAIAGEQHMDEQAPQHDPSAPQRDED